jgi:hypothetical protein
MGLEPDVITVDAVGGPTPGGLAVAEAPPRARQVARAETEAAAYARRANRIAIRHAFGNIVAIIEVVSPGNKDSKHALEEFLGKAIEYLQKRINLLILDLFPPTRRDPQGLHQVIWESLTDAPFAPRPADKPLTVASYDAWDGVTAYVDPVAVGDRLPDAPLFLAPGWYIKVPLEQTYMASWDVAPAPLRDRVAPGGRVAGA